MTDRNNSNIPKLRYPEFTGYWECVALDEVFELRNGYTPPTGNPSFWENGKIPWFRMEDIRENGHILSDAIQHITPNAVKGGGLFKKGSFILATTATIGEHALLIADSLANQRFTNLKIRESQESKLDTIYLYYYLFIVDEYCKVNVNQGGFSSVNMGSLKKCPIFIPSLPEQKKIAEFLSSVDDVIAAENDRITALKDHKKGLMQQLFPQKGQTLPSKRFPGFIGEWEVKKFKEFTCSVGMKNKKNESYESYSISNEYGFIPQQEQFEGTGGYLKDADRSMYIIVPPKSFAYNPARINVGSIGYQNLGKSVIVSSLYEVFQTLDCCDDGFLWHWMHSSHFNNMVLDVQEGGVRQYLFYENLKECKIALPKEISEQKKIAECLTSLDDEILAQQQKVDALKEHKRGLMQIIFPTIK